MKKINILIAVLMLSLSHIANSKTNANVIGHVVFNGEHIPFASVGVKGTTIGTVTDASGHYQLKDLPTGEQTIFVRVLGYKPQEHTITLITDQTIEVKFNLEEDVLNLNDVVISADRAEQMRTEAPVIVNTISSKIFKVSQSVTLSEGLNFSPGLRVENNCQNCGFSQVRMNGMEGPYSQILINNQPIFSSLAGVYGLEMLPSNMIERVEVVRGGGSSLYGSNAIAGTINIILKEPKLNTYEAGATYALTGVGVDGSAGSAPDYTINFNTSVVSDDEKSGASLYGFTRKRDMFDANDDTFSEIAPLENLTFGARVFYKFGYRDKLALDFFSIREKRDGGDLQDYPVHQRNIAEALEHNMNVGALTYNRYVRESDLLSIYASGQVLGRDSYYGAEKSLNDYGNTKDKTYNVGVQYKALLGKSTLVGGVENTGGFLLDKKLGAPILGDDGNGDIIILANNPHTIVSDQLSITTGAFAQYDLWMDKLKLSLGARFDHYDIVDNTANGETKTGNVFIPRLSAMYHLLEGVQARVSYSQGYRAPQIFNEDLHIETSGSRQVFHVNDPHLTQETSHSITASLDFNRLVGTIKTGLLIEGFYTKLVDAFINDFGDPDANGTVIYTRMNAEGGAVVQGVNIEFKLKPLQDFELTSGFTVQSSAYEEAEEDFGEERFFRTPNQYGYFAINWDFNKNLSLSTTGNYTGRMLVPYFGTANPDGELRESDNFFDLGAKLAYTVKMNGASVQFSAGIKNIFNSYQSDFDIGIDRDPSYIYGPVLPRTVYFGIRFGNLLKQ